MMIKVPIELRVSRAQAAGQHANNVAKQGELTSSIAFVTMAEKGMIDDVTATENIDTFAPWVAGVNVTTDQMRTYGDEAEGSVKKLYRCVQAHTTQADWTPDVSPSLWVEVGDPSVEYPAWSQPIGAHDAYEQGAKVTHNEKKWVSDVDANAWEPGVYGWTEVKNEEPETVEGYEPGKSYYAGDKVMFNGAAYECIAPEGTVCVWSPAEYPAYWQAIEL